MTATDEKATLRQYLGEGRQAIAWKLDGLKGYDIRRPLTPTGTNLLGLVKHVACMEALYFGIVFARPFGEPLPWLDDGAEPNAELWVTPDESRADVVGLYERACAHADATIDALDLETVGRVSWWRNTEVTLHKILVHMIAETHRHTGHADIVRELVDGRAGFLPGNSNLAPGDKEWWAAYHQQVEEAAQVTAEA